MKLATKTRAVVIWEGSNRPIVLAIYGPNGETVAAAQLLPMRALTLAQELLTYGVQAIKAELKDQ